MASKSTSSDRGNQRFISTLMKAPLLEREHEYDLSRRWREEGDEKALDELVVSHGRLVVRIAWRFRGSGLPIDDLIQEGNSGLLDAADRFDPERLVRFSTYATWWIVAAIQNYILRNSSVVRVATTPTQRRLFFNLRRARAKMQASQDGFTSTDREALAEELGVNVTDVEKMEAHLSRPDQSLNTPIGEDDGATLQDFFTADGPSPEDIALDHEQSQAQRKWIDQALDKLSPREQEIIQQRFLSDKKATLAEIGESFGVSKERIRQIESKALSKMGTILTDIVHDRRDIAGH
ncbi:MAG: RNA polymerase factor sigma-32 [Alphaproteobacteria bacterium]|nr:RNA polymerase factor sigma-32 [Alphaproteobacteria bacterium]